MGKPIPSDRDICPLGWRRTGGTETSQYPEEKKTTVISQVAASERDAAQTLVGQPAGGLKDHKIQSNAESKLPGKQPHRR